MIITGCLLVGIGLGMLLGDTAAGTLIGLGVGFILETALRPRREGKDPEKT